IEPAVSSDIQVLAARMPADAVQQTVRLLGRRCKGKTGGAPGALADAECAFILKQTERRGDIGTGKTASPLNWSKIVAQPRLHVLDRRTEAGDVVFRKRRQSLQEHEPAQMGGFCIRKRRKSGKYVTLIRS